MELIGVDVSIWLNFLLAVFLALGRYSDRQFRLKFRRMEADIDEKVRQDAQENKMLDALREVLTTHRQTSEEVARILRDSPTRHESTRVAIKEAAESARLKHEEIIANQEVGLSRQTAIIDKLNNIQSQLERIEKTQTKLDTLAQQVTDRTEPGTLRFELVQALKLVNEGQRTIQELKADVKTALSDLADREPNAPRPSTDDLLAEAEKIQARMDAPPTAEEKPEGAESEHGE